MIALTLPVGRTVVCIGVVALAMSGCGHSGSLGPPTPSGATDIGGPPMTSAPPPPPGWNPKDVVPQSQQQAQDTVVGYLKRTLATLPPGTVIDATRYAGAGHNSYCDDNDSGPTAPMRFHTIGELKTPAAADAQNVVRTVGEVWRSWGWYVYERDGFRQPNEFGYGPDGYRLQIVTAAEAGYPPSVQASSPCFSREIASDDLPVPEVISAG
jgi:hypothetical protein